MNFNLKAVPTVPAQNTEEAVEFFLSISKDELLSQHKKDCEQFCITVSYALAMLCSPHGFTHDMDDTAILGLVDYVQSDEGVTGLAAVVEYQQGRPHLLIGFEY